MSDSYEDEIIRRMVTYDLMRPGHRPWEEIVAEVREQVAELNVPDVRSTHDLTTGVHHA